MAVSTGVRNLGLAFLEAQARKARVAGDRIQAHWWTLQKDDLSASWRAGVGAEMVQTITAGQFASAAAADDYVDSIVDAEGADPDRAGRVRPSGFSGVAADGRSLSDLMYLPVITSKLGIASGLSVNDALMMGLRQALRLGTSEVTQAGRSSVGVSMTGQRTIQGYVRVVQPPACARCVLLAGTEYGWNKGFQRHPHCDCVHLPTTLIARNQHRRGSLASDEFTPTTRPGSGARGFIDPGDYFRSLSAAEQNRVFGEAGARAIREGADISQVVNARRGMYTTQAYGRTVRATREGTTRRGLFYQQERRRALNAGQTTRADFRLRTPRILPEEIFNLAESRDEAVAMLRRFGYLT